MIQEHQDVYYDFDKAVHAAAKQNYHRDVVRQLERGPWHRAGWQVQDVYLQEARLLLKKDGKNYIPDLKTHKQIVYVKK